MRSLYLLLLCALNVHALYFYLEGGEEKCFSEELPRELMVTGTYKAEEWNAEHNSWEVNPENGMQITEVEEHHQIVNQKSKSSGRFTFTSGESGEHQICLRANSPGWFQSTKMRVTLDIEVGDPTVSSDEDHKETLSDLATRVRELKERVNDIRREQSYQRASEREAEFRDQSELTNSRAVWWTVAQMGVLGSVCYWQISHLKGFFVAKKLV